MRGLRASLAYTLVHLYPDVYSVTDSNLDMDANPYVVAYTYPECDPNTCPLC